MVKTCKRAVACVMVLLVTLLSGCVPDVSEYNYILDHWKGEWQGWYEISNATGIYAEYDGIRDTCTTDISMDPKTRLWMEVFQMDGEKICDFTGAYKHNENNKYGEAWFNEISDNKNQKVSAYIVLDGESQGDDNLGVFKGRIGKEKSGMDILMYLHRKTENEKLCIMNVQAVNFGVDELGQDVGYGYAPPASYQVQEGDCFYENWDELQQNSNTVEDYDFHLDEFMKIKELKEEGVVLEIQRQEWQVEYDQEFTLHSLVMVMDGANTTYQIKFSR